MESGSGLMIFQW